MSNTKKVKKGQRTNLSQTKKNTKYSQEYISKENRANQGEYKSATKYTCTCKKKKEIIWKRSEENSKNAESFTKWIKSNHRIVMNMMNISENY